MKYNIKIKWVVVIQVFFISISCNNRNNNYIHLTEHDDGITKYVTLGIDSNLLLEQWIDTSGIIQFEEFYSVNSIHSLRWYDRLGRLERSLNYIGNDSSYNEHAYNNGVILYSYTIENGIESGVWTYYQNGSIHSKVYFPSEEYKKKRIIVNSPVYLQRYDRPSMIRHYVRKEIYWVGEDLVRWEELYDKDGRLISKAEKTTQLVLDSMKEHYNNSGINGTLLTPDR